MNFERVNGSDSVDSDSLRPPEADLVVMLPDNETDVPIMLRPIIELSDGAQLNTDAPNKWKIATLGEKSID